MWRVPQRSAPVANKTTTRWLGRDKLWTRIAVKYMGRCSRLKGTNAANCTIENKKKEWQGSCRLVQPASNTVPRKLQSERSDGVLWVHQQSKSEKRDDISRREGYLAELSFAWRFSSTQQNHIVVVMERTLLLANVVHSHNKCAFILWIAYPGRTEIRDPSLLSMWLLQACNETGATQFPWHGCDLLYFKKFSGQSLDDLWGCLRWYGLSSRQRR